MNELLLEKEANAFRQMNGLASNEPIRLKSLLQKLNVVTIFSTLSSDFSGMALKVQMNEQTDRFMLVNSSQSVGKQHFTICHELYHLFVQQSFTSQVCRTGLFDKKADPEEYNADLFSSYLLLPKDGLIENIPNEELDNKKLTLSTILSLEHYYSCSRRALLYRLKKLLLIKSEEYDVFTVDIKRGALEYGFQTDLYEPGNDGVIIGDYGLLAKELYDKDKISQSHYYTLLTDLGIDLTKLDESTNGEF